MKDYYLMLGVLPDAEDVVIKAAYKALVQRYHPDRYSGEPSEAERKTAELNDAYEVLSNSVKRAEYDKQRQAHKNDATDSFLTNPLKVLMLGVFLASCVLGFYFYQFHDGLSGNQEQWGQFGDFVGGLLNPTFGFLALLTLVATLRMQVKEFRASVTELKNSANALNKQNESLERQNFEASFFHMLKLHNYAEAAQ